MGQHARAVARFLRVTVALLAGGLGLALASYATSSPGFSQAAPTLVLLVDDPSVPSEVFVSSFYGSSDGQMQQGFDITPRFALNEGQSVGWLLFVQDDAALWETYAFDLPVRDVTIAGPAGTRHADEVVQGKGIFGSSAGPSELTTDRELTTGLVEASQTFAPLSIQAESELVLAETLSGRAVRSPRFFKPYFDDDPDGALPLLVGESADSSFYQPRTLSASFEDTSNYRSLAPLVTPTRTMVSSVGSLTWRDDIVLVTQLEAIYTDPGTEGLRQLLLILAGAAAGAAGALLVESAIRFVSPSFRERVNRIDTQPIDG